MRRDRATSLAAASSGRIARSPPASPRWPSTTDWYTPPASTAGCTASTPKPAAATGSTRRASRSGARRWWPTGKCIWARARNCFGCSGRRQGTESHQPHSHARRHLHHAHGRQRHAFRGHEQALVCGEEEGSGVRGQGSEKLTNALPLQWGGGVLCAANSQKPRLLLLLRRHFSASQSAASGMPSPRTADT